MSLPADINSRVCKVCVASKPITEFGVSGPNSIYRKHTCLTCEQKQRDAKRTQAIDCEQNRICQTCLFQKPISNFSSKGNTTLLTGQTVRYRSVTCRKCEKARKRASGVCVMCWWPAHSNSSYCEKHLKLLRESIKRRHRKDKAAAFAHYGEKCAYCGDARQLFLTIDHIHDNGAEHRRTQRSGQNRGHDIYAWLRKMNYPEGFQTLCYNCNCVKSQIGENDLLTYLVDNKSNREIADG